MAKTWQEYQAEMIATHQAVPELSAVNSPSETARWKLIYFVIAVAMSFFEQVLELYYSLITSTVSSVKIGTPAWLAEQARLFQLGDSIEIINGVPTYPSGASGSKIITRVVAKNSSEGICIVKVAKGSITDLQALSSEELLQFSAYLNRIQFAGTRIKAISISADLLTIGANVRYNAIYDAATVKQNVIAAINNFLAALPEDGLFWREKLRDSMQSVTGIVDVELTGLQSIAGGEIVAIGQYYEARAGYIKLNSATPIESTITMIPA
ncbi:hypothetical protein SAMN05421780_101532 [Flexibacter flexilis DSM 6793]|uniref:Baseplate J-like protein n=2 Tax=Flexibacter flexilis TaxID=998 RepID=A0A1I1E3U7_9BACT|nr:hypothetical protein SAMN05421780_101532 [Flexibacter flexilis DSM 6793]